MVATRFSQQPAEGLSLAGDQLAELRTIAGRRQATDIIENAGGAQLCSDVMEAQTQGQRLAQARGWRLVMEIQLPERRVRGRDRVEQGARPWAWSSGWIISSRLWPTKSPGFNPALRI